jgi:outer membrane protein OmpA-like peptidoglycan-associated protein
MQDADYFRIQNITLGYDFTKIWKNDLFEQLRLYVQAQNLYSFTKYTGVDPECTSDAGKSQDNQNFIRGVDVGLYPSARTFLVGLSVKFSDKRDHKTAGPAPVIIRDNDEINRLNSEIEQLRAENNRLKNAPTPAREKEVVTKKEVITFPYLVNFDINKTVVVNRERVNIGNVATMIKAAEGKKFAITGYADQQTGNPEINAKLAQQRAQAVYDVLTKECGIPASRLVLDSKGGVDYMYFKDAEMSRSVIISEVK